MKLQLRENQNNEEEKLELWLDITSDNSTVRLYSKKSGTDYVKVELHIYSDGSWSKCHSGNLNNEQLP